MKELIKGLKVLFLTLFAYLFQACAMQYFAVGGVTASLPFATLAVFVVSLGKKYAFCASCIIGICMECMLSNVPVLYLLAYPVITMLCAQLFADLTDRQRERRLNNHKGKNIFSRMRQRELPSLMRIPLCALLMDLIWHIVMCVYLYLIGVEIDFGHVYRLFRAVLYTGFLTVVVMLPMRAILGMYRRPKRKKKKTDEDDYPLLRRPSFAYDDMEDDETEPVSRADMPPADEPAEDVNEAYEFYPEEGEW